MTPKQLRDFKKALKRLDARWKAPLWSKAAVRKFRRELKP